MDDDDTVVAEWVAWLVDAAQSGETLDLAAGLAPESDDRNPAWAEAWGTERQLPAAALRTVLIDRDLSVGPRGLRINGVRITGPVDLENVQFEHPLHLTGSRVEPNIDLSGSTLKELNLSGSYITSLNLTNATITGGLVARDEFTTGMIRAPGASIGGQLDLRGAKLTNPNQDVLDLGGATVTGGLVAEGLTATGKINITDASIGGQLELRGAKLTNPNQDVLDLTGATITRGLVASDEFTATGKIHIPGASIGGQLELRGAKLTNPNQDVLDLGGATVTGGLVAEGLTAAGAIRAPGASIGVELNLDGATLTNPKEGVALELGGATVRSLWLTMTEVDGTIDLNRTTITDLRTPGDSVPHGQLIATGWEVTDVHGLIRTNRAAAKRWLKTAGTRFTVQPWHALAAVYDRTANPPTPGDSDTMPPTRSRSVHGVASSRCAGPTGRSPDTATTRSPPRGGWSSPSFSGPCSSPTTKPISSRPSRTPHARQQKPTHTTTAAIRLPHLSLPTLTAICTPATHASFRGPTPSPASSPPPSAPRRTGQ
ncbi:hypothetical protein K8O92_27365 [Nocardia asteroides]|nr:hypothetical protein K8O92_27365 [Nocardia asteroides]